MVVAAVFWTSWSKMTSKEDWDVADVKHVINLVKDTPSERAP